MEVNVIYCGYVSFCRIPYPQSTQVDVVNFTEAQEECPEWELDLEGLDDNELEEVRCHYWF